ncbi:MAG: serine/threonine-protein kinase [Myxococcota bacterium]
MSAPLAFLPWEHEVLDGPHDVGSEQRWRVRAPDGRELVVAQLAPDLARDDSIRRRWVRDAQRLQSLAIHSVVATIAIGPEPDPRAPGAEPPWRVRVDPKGESLERWLQRAPVTLEEFTGLFAAVADALQAVHATGAVLRDLRPEQVLRTMDGRVMLADVGLSRVDVLSSHTASSLLLQGSTYAAPEQVATTAVDLRSDLFSLGVMMWQALTGHLPFEDGPAFLRREANLPSLTAARQDVRANIDLLVRSCLSIDPARRPATAMDVALVLRGGAATSLAEQATTTCQHCAAKLRVGQRLCLECGRVSVKFVHAQPGEATYSLDLRALGEDARTLKWLQTTLHDVSRGPIRVPEFLVGSVHLYSDEEKMTRIRLPARLFNGLSPETADQLQTMMQEQGIDAKVVSARDVRRTALEAFAATAAAATIAGIGWAVGVAALGWTFFAITIITLLAMSTRHSNRRAWVQRTRAHFQLRPLPAALPASDPLVARLAGLLSPNMADDVRAVVAEMALLAQRLVDHRGQFVRDVREVEVLTAPVVPLVGSVEARVQELSAIDAELAQLDEGAMVRGLAAADARKDGPEKRAPILESLDRLRALEDRRAGVFQRLLEAQSLLTRTVELGLAQHDDGTEHERQLALAVAGLTGT